MKKIFNIFITVFLLFSCTNFVYADNLSYNLDDLSLVISISENFIVLTRDIEENHPYLLEKDIDIESLMQQFEDNHIYLDAIDDEKGIDIVVTMLENYEIYSIFDFNTYKHRELEEFADNLLSMDTQDIISTAKQEGDVVISDTQNASLEKYYISKRSEATFIVFETQIEHNGTLVFGRQFTTVINGQGINITLHSYKSEISLEHIDILNTIVNSIEFTKIEDKIKKKAETISQPSTPISDDEKEILQIEEQELPLGYEKSIIDTDKIIGFTVISVLIILLAFMIFTLASRNIPKKRHAGGYPRNHTRSRY